MKLSLIIPLALSLVACGGRIDINIDGLDPKPVDGGVMCGLTPTDGGYSYLGEDEGGPYDFWNPAASGPLYYWGGPVLTGVTNVYVIWYGDWSNSTTPGILEDYLLNISGQPYFQILRGYYQLYTDQKTYITGCYNLVQEIWVGYTRGTVLGPGDTRGIVEDALNAKSLPVDENAVYYVLTAPGVSESLGTNNSFCDKYCGYHRSADYDGTEIKYIFVGDMSSCDSCTAAGFFSNPPPSPNGDWSGDGMVSVMTHELCEATTDPLITVNNAWLDGQKNNETSDMCAWRFEPVQFTDAGAPYNVTWGNRNFLIQQLWVNVPDGGYCGLHP